MSKNIATDTYECRRLGVSWNGAEAVVKLDDWVAWALSGSGSVRLEIAADGGKLTVRKLPEEKNK